MRPLAIQTLLLLPLLLLLLAGVVLPTEATKEGGSSANTTLQAQPGKHHVQKVSHTHRVDGIDGCSRWLYRPVHSQLICLSTVDRGTWSWTSTNSLIVEWSMSQRDQRLMLANNWCRCIYRDYAHYKHFKLANNVDALRAFLSSLKSIIQLSPDLSNYISVPVCCNCHCLLKLLNFIWICIMHNDSLIFGVWTMQLRIRIIHKWNISQSRQCAMLTFKKLVNIPLISALHTNKVSRIRTMYTLCLAQQMLKWLFSLPAETIPPFPTH